MGELKLAEARARSPDTGCSPLQAEARLTSAPRLHYRCRSRRPCNPLSALRPRTRDEAVREIGIHGQGNPANIQLLHYDETQTVDEAISLIAMPFEPCEGGTLLVRGCPVNLAEPFTIETLADSNSLSVANFPSERDRLRYYVIRSQERARQTIDPQFPKLFVHAFVMLIPGRNQGEKESRVEKYHRAGLSERYKSWRSAISGGAF